MHELLDDIVIARYLDDLEARIIPDVEDQLQAEWLAFTRGDFTGDIFSPKRTATSPPRIVWPKVSINRSQIDIDAMLLQQYRACSEQLDSGGGGLMSIRANYGTAILPTLFGAKLFVMDESLDTLQTCRPLGAAMMQGVVDKGVPALERGLGEKVFEAGQRFAEIAKQYPKIGKYVHIYHPDLQGPMDVCEMIWGSEMFVDLIDQPDLVHLVLQLVSETYVKFMQKWNEVVGVNRDNWSVHWGMMQAGKIMIRTDSGMNLSPEIYDAFIMPYDQMLLNTLGGGAVHFCGRGSHYISSACSMNGLYAINLSQPHLNEIEEIYRNTVDKGIKLLGFSREHAKKAIANGRELHGCVHCPS